MYDNKRSPQNVNDNTLFVNTPAAEGAYRAFDIDILSNGSGDTYVWWAFAEAPAKYSNAK
jgi:hypothetical protein